MSRDQQADSAAVRGVDLDAETRCVHYDSPRDVIAIKFACCGTYYACHRCHQALADHDAQQWPAGQFDVSAVRCGVCASEFSIRAYLGCDHTCPQCGATFNPGCARHRDRYFGG